MSRRRLEPVPPEYHRPPKPVVRSLKDLMARELPPVKWIVPKILPEGVTLLAGKAKVRKSWLMLGLCCAVAAGGVAFGKIRVDRGEALYAALEDNERRLQSRSRKVLAGLGGEEVPEGFFYATDWPRLGEGGIEALSEWLDEHPDCRLVVLDTLAKVRPRSTRHTSGGYQEDYEAVEPLQKLAADRQVAIVVVAHTRKASAADILDEINATTGLAGSVDGFLIFRTERGKNEAAMHVDGREIEEPGELAIRWDRQLHGWMIVGEAEETRMTEQRRAVLDALRYAGEPIGPKEISAATGIPHGSVRNLLGVLVVDGRVDRTGRGRYRLPEFVAEDVTLSSAAGGSDDNRNEHRYAQKPPVVTDVIDVTGSRAYDVSRDVNDNNDKQALSSIGMGKTDVTGIVTGQAGDDNDVIEHGPECECWLCGEEE